MTKLWKTPIDLAQINTLANGTMVETLDIKFIAHDENSLTANMPIDKRTIQPYGILHGGASATLAETVGSVASQMALERPGEQKVAGIELNISHLRQATKGSLTAVTTPVRIGRRLHVWDIRMSDDDGRLISIARLTTAVL